MLISLSTVPIVLLIVQCVISVEQFKSKKLPRRHTEVIRTLNSNHPPLKENYDNSSALDDQEKKSISSDSKVRAVNRPQLSENIDPFHIMSMNDYESDLILPQIARSVNAKKRVSASGENGKLKTMRRAPTSSEVDTAPKIHRRRSQVRRVKVNKNQLNEFINKTESALKETTSIVREDNQKVRTHTVNQVHKKSNNQPSLKRRKGLREAVVPIVESENFVFSHSGDFHYSYEGGDGTKAAQSGELKSSRGGAGSAVEGSYSYIGKDGHDYSLTYTADENGYRPVGAHLPTPPPIPPAIQRALNHLATKSTPEPNTERINLLKQGFFV